MAEAKRPGGEYLVDAQFENGKLVKGTGRLVNANGEPIEATKAEKEPAGEKGGK
jgi:hypothetical protein